MPTLMKTIMDAFDAEGKRLRSEGDYAAAWVYSTAENLANQCHGMSNDETVTFLENALLTNEKMAEGEETSHWRECRAILRRFCP